MAFRIVRDFGGVNGFHVAYDVFSEAAEQRLFEIHGGGGAAREGHGPETFVDLNADPSMFFAGAKRLLCVYLREPNSRLPEWWQLINAIQDCGLDPDHVVDNYCMSLTYPPGATIPRHWDSRYRWGKVVFGVCLGAPGQMTMHPVLPNGWIDKTRRPVRIELPRRCFYAMEGEARTLWQHSLEEVGVASVGPQPHWNPLGLRRSLTFRPTKTAGVEWLKMKEKAAISAGQVEEAAVLRARIAEQTVTGKGGNWPEHHNSRPAEKGDPTGAYTPDEVAKAVAWAQAYHAELAPGGMLHEVSKRRLPARDALFLPQVSPATRALYNDDPQPPYEPRGLQSREPQAASGWGYQGGGEADDDAALQRVLEASKPDAGGGGERWQGGGGGGGFDADELQRAIAASLGRGGQARGGDGGGEAVGEDDFEAELRRGIAASKAAAAAEAYELRRATELSLLSAGGGGGGAAPTASRKRAAAAAPEFVDLTGDDD